jgi:hypothetical protein
MITLSINAFVGLRCRLTQPTDELFFIYCLENLIVNILCCPLSPRLMITLILPL